MQLLKALNYLIAHGLLVPLIKYTLDLAIYTNRQIQKRRKKDADPK